MLCARLPPLIWKNRILEIISSFRFIFLKHITCYSGPDVPYVYHSIYLFILILGIVVCPRVCAPPNKLSLCVWNVCNFIIQQIICYVRVNNLYSAYFLDKRAYVHFCHKSHYRRTNKKLSILFADLKSAWNSI